MYDYLIVGAGFAGSVLAERLANDGKKILICEKRNHIGGNAYDYYNEDGILIHKYGPHIFHTNSKEVVDYLSKFTKWREYEHRVLASVDGQLVPIPINLDTINKLFNKNLDSEGVRQFFDLRANASEIDEVKTSEDVILSTIGQELYEKFFKNYTIKQWGMSPAELDKSVTSRVPTRTNRDDRYFTDTYQMMPMHGYTRMFENMLDHSNIHIMLNADYKDVRGRAEYGKIIWTGTVDSYFNYCYGKLPYRSLEFEFETHDLESYQSATTVNYPNEHQYTRITEFKKMTGQQHPKTTTVKEFPKAEGEEYYPIPKPENKKLYQKYEALAKEEDVIFVGRLARYQYMDMHQVVAQALTEYGKIVGKSMKEVVNEIN